MKKLYPFLFLFLYSFLQSQCGQYTQRFTENIRKIRFFDEQNGYCFGGSTLLTTTNGGSSWNLFDLPDYSTLITPLMETDIINDNSAIIVGHNGRILKTNNKGVTWEYQSLRNDGREFITSVDFTDDNIGYIVGTNEAVNEIFIYKTTDGGNKWIKLSSNINSVQDSFNFPYEYVKLNIKFFNENEGFMWRRYDLYRTVNGGVTWVKLTSNNEFYNSGLIMNVGKNQNNKLYLSTSDYATGSKIYTSSDNGTTWSLNTDLQYTNNISINMYGEFTMLGNEFISVQNGQLLKYNTETHSILQKPIGNFPYLANIYTKDGQNIYLSFYGTGSPGLGKKILKTNDSGNVWQTISEFANDENTSWGNEFRIEKDGNTLLMSRKEKMNDFYNKRYVIYKSLDNGVSWRQVAKEQTDQSTSWINFATVLRNKNNYVSYFSSRTLIVNNTQTDPIYYLTESNDGGQSWSTSNVNLPQSIMPSKNIFQPEENILYVKEYDNSILLSTNKGQTWKTITTPTVAGGTFYGSQYNSPNEIYAWGRKDNWPTDYDYFLYKTTDQGVSWQNILNIPDNNGNDQGYIGSHTVFGSNYAIASVGGSKYYKINLTDNTYTNYTGTLPGSPVYSEKLKILKDNFWYYPDTSNFIYSQDFGQTWKERFCLVCGENVMLNSTNNDILIYNQDNSIERLKDKQFDVPKIFGNSNPAINSTEEYFIPLNFFSDTEWILSSGGTISFDPDTKYYKIKVTWTTNGSHTLKARKLNECGYSNFTEFPINVGVLATKENNINDSLEVYPNPFSDKLMIKSSAMKNQIKIILYNVTGQIVLQQEVLKNGENYEINNLNSLPKGLYFIEIINGKEKVMKKVIKN